MQFNLRYLAIRTRVHTVNMELDSPKPFLRRSQNQAVTDESVTKWLIYQGVLYIQTATDKQQQCNYDVVGLDRRNMSCNMFSIWPLADGRQDIGHITKPEPHQWRPGQ